MKQSGSGGLWSSYSTEGRPLKAYSAFLAIFNGVFAGVLLLARNRHRPIPERIGVGDLLYLSGATYKLSRLLVKDWVTSPLRAPFVEYQGPSDIPSELSEKPRGSGFRYAMGELVT